MNERFLASVRALLERTDAGTVRWEETSDEDSYRLNIGKGLMLRVSRRRDDDNDVFVWVQLINAEGRELENIGCWRSTASRASLDFLVEMFDSARRSALRVDTVLDELDAFLAQTKPASQAPKASSPDDDIPF